MKFILSLLLWFFLTSCASPEALRLRAEAAEGKLILSVSNQSGRNLEYTPLLISYPKRPGGDFSIEISDVRGNPMPLCGMLDTDKLPQALELQSGSHATFSEDIASLVIAHCLTPGATYMVRIKYVEPKGASGNPIQSNEIKFLAPE